MPKNHNPHDKFIRKILSKRKSAIQYIKKFAPEYIVQNLDLRSIKISPNSYVDEKLEEYISDLNYICNWKSKGKKSPKVRISFLLEHKSYLPKYPHLQLLRYLLQAWEQDMEEKRSLTLTIPIILYHGKKKWKQRKFEENFDLPDEQLKQYIPNFEYLLTDLSKFTDEEILGIGANFLTNTLLTLKHSWNEEYILNNTHKIFRHSDIYMTTEEGRLYLHVLQIYIFQIIKFDEKRLNLYQENIPKYLKEIVMSTYDMLIQKGMEKGMEEGMEKGVTKIIRGIIETQPSLTNEQIAQMTKQTVASIKKIRASINQK